MESEICAKSGDSYLVTGKKSFCCSIGNQSPAQGPVHCMALKKVWLRSQGFVVPRRCTKSQATICMPDALEDLCDQDEPFMRLHRKNQELISLCGGHIIIFILLACHWQEIYCLGVPLFVKDHHE